MRALAACLLLALAGHPVPGQAGPAETPAAATSVPARPFIVEAPPPSPLCLSRYSDVLTSEDPRIEAYEQLPDHNYAYCVRDVATYEHVYYGADGKLRRSYLRSEIHGTGFALRATKEGDTLLVTNQHVADQPDVTDDAHVVDGVPAGSRKVREVVKLVKNQEDDYEPGQILATRVLADQAMDISVLRVHRHLNLMPYPIGDSSQLKVGNALVVRGFPLGAFAASNNGKVISVGQWDSERGWAHEDFVTDALLNQGNSGSPVFAISCKTGQLELVGVYHAGYRDAAALNVVVAIDQLKNELTTLKVPHRNALRTVEVTPADRERLVNLLFAERAHSLLFPYADRTASVELTDPGRLRFAILSDTFPLSDATSLELWDDRTHDGFGTLNAIGFRAAGTADTVPASALDPSVRDHFDRLYADMWRQLMSVIDYRAVAARASLDPVAHQRASAQEQALKARSGDQRDLWSQVGFDLDQLVNSAEAGHLPVASLKGVERPDPPPAR
ncbi:MAG TPA: serine protease [Myxococcales bacterium]|nr:serine protease [Myxococcales bacterium]